MTVWDTIYQQYKKTGKEYATLRKGLMPAFLEFMQSNEFKFKKVLDIGCGNGKYLIYLKDLGFEVTGIDSSPTAVEMTKSSVGKDADIRCVNMYEYELPESRYDLVISIAAIHHGLKKQVRDVIRRIYHSLIPGGHFFITVPDNEGSTHWTNMAGYKEVEPGVRVPITGPEKDLPHSCFTEAELQEIFSEFKNVRMQLLIERGRWIITGNK